VRIAATIACPDELHLFTVTLYAKTIGTEWQCSNRINERCRITPPLNRFTDRCVKKETSPAECATHDPNLAKRSWRRARPECATNLRGDALGGRSFNGDANPTSSATNVNTARQMHQPSTDHRRHPVIGPRDDWDADRQTKIARSRGAQRADPRPRKHLGWECALIKSTRFAQQERALRR